MRYDNTYIQKIESSFTNVKYQIDYLNDFFKEEITDMGKFLREYYYNKQDFLNEIEELDSRLRALRDKLNET